MSSKYIDITLIFFPIEDIFLNAALKSISLITQTNINIDPHHDIILTFTNI
ncbi:hypothetical protein [Azospirillum palustre]